MTELNISPQKPLANVTGHFQQTHCKDIRQILSLPLVMKTKDKIILKNSGKAPEVVQTRASSLDTMIGSNCMITMADQSNRYISGVSGSIVVLSASVRLHGRAVARRRFM